MHQTEPLDNILKLPPGVTSVTVENLCCGLSILEKKQSVIMTTRESIDSLQNSIQKILLGYSRMLLTIHAAIDIDNLTNVTDDLAKTIIDEFHSTLTTVQMNPTVDLSGTESCLAAQQLGHDSHESKANSHSENPSESSSPESDGNLEVQFNNLKINDIDDIAALSEVPNAFVTTEKPEVLDGQYRIGVNDDKNSEEITELKPFKKDGKEASRSKFEMSITNTCRNFLQRQESKVLFDHSRVDAKFDPLVSYLNDTNPFKKDLMRINSTENSGAPPPLPPRFNKRIEDDSVETLLSFIPQETVKIVYRASPVMYDLSKTNTLFETKQGSPGLSFPSTDVNCIGGSKQDGLSVEDDDKGYQSDATSPILKCSVPQQDRRVMRVGEEKSHGESQMNNRGPVIYVDHFSPESPTEWSFSLAQLSRNIASVFNVNGKGYIPLKEFLSIFIPFNETYDYYEFIQASLPETATLVLTRTDNTELFDQYERTMSNLIANYQSTQGRRLFGKCEDFVLIRLSSIMKILSKMNIISKEEIILQRRQNGLPGYAPSQVMADVIKLISTYGSTYGCN